MKSYLDLVPISAKVHRKQNRMSIICIVLAVFLVTAIFGMADMFIQTRGSYCCRLWYAEFSRRTRIYFAWKKCEYMRWK